MSEPWLVTGAAGFIGSHLVRALLAQGHSVVALDDLSTGKLDNLPAHPRLRFLRGDVRDGGAVAAQVRGVRGVFHLAAIASVPASIADPRLTHEVNVGGFFNVAMAAAEAGVPLVYASSAAVYGDCPLLPSREGREGRPLSPYAASKRQNELEAAGLSARGLRSVGLRFFNVVGARQDPRSPYAGVVCRWVHELQNGVQPTIFGDGTQTRDFCPVEDIVQANLLAAQAGPEAWGRAFNVGLGRETSLNELFLRLRGAMVSLGHPVGGVEPARAPARLGDVHKSRASITKARRVLHFRPRGDLDGALRSVIRGE